MQHGRIEVIHLSVVLWWWLAGRLARCLTVRSLLPRTSGGKLIGAGIYTRKMVTIKKRAGVIPYIFSSRIALLSSLLSCSFYLLDLKTILVWTFLKRRHSHNLSLLRPPSKLIEDSQSSVYSQQTFLYNGKCLRRTILKKCR